MISKSPELLVKVILPALLLAPVHSFAAPADGLSGTWKIVRSTSSWSNGQFPKDMSLTIQVGFTADTIQYHSVNSTDPAHPGSLDFSVPMDGKPHPIPDTGRINQIAVRRIGPNQLEILEEKDGDVVVGAYWWLSPNGKQLIRRGIARGADNHSHEYEEFFDKQ